MSNRHPITSSDMEFIAGLLSSQRHCEYEYEDMERNPWPTWATLCTQAIIVLTIILEIVVHSNLTGISRKFKEDEESATVQRNTNPSGGNDATQLTLLVQDQPQPRSDMAHVPPHAASPDNGETSTTTAAPAEKEQDPGAICSLNNCCLPSPNPMVRANRLAIALLLYIPITVAFSFRMHHLVSRHNAILSPKFCNTDQLEEPNWTVVTIFVILPYVLATSAFLRALIDAVLVRWNKNLSYNLDGSCMWTPCMPVLGIMVTLLLLWECVKVPIAVLMGKREVSLWTRSEGVVEIEMRAEEGQGLIDEMEGGGSEEGNDGPPAYDELLGIEDEGVGKHAGVSKV